MKKKGFTLIELLVVIAIIATLAAILFPVFAQANMAAKKTADLNNVKQISMGMHMYAGDNDDHTLVKDEEAGYDWYPNLYPYVKSTGVFKTPAYHAPQQEYPTDYLVNGLFAHGLNLTSFSAPSNQISISLRKSDEPDTDYHPWPNDGTSWDDENSYSDEGENWFESRILKNGFFNGSNYGFADGHAKFHRFENTLSKLPYPGEHNVDRIWL